MSLGDLFFNCSFADMRTVPFVQTFLKIADIQKIVLCRVLNNRLCYQALNPFFNFKFHFKFVLPFLLINHFFVPFLEQAADFHDIKATYF